MSAWVLTWVVSVALLLVRSLSVVVVEAQAGRARAGAPAALYLPTPPSACAQPAVIVPRFQVTVLVMPRSPPLRVAEKKLVPAGIGSLRTPPMASVFFF